MRVAKLLSQTFAGSRYFHKVTESREGETGARRVKLPVAFAVHNAVAWICSREYPQRRDPEEGTMAARPRHS